MVEQQIDAWHLETIHLVINGQVNFLDNTLIIFTLTGVQLEVGSLTDFEHLNLQKNLHFVNDITIAEI